MKEAHRVNLAAISDTLVCARSESEKIEFTCRNISILLHRLRLMMLISDISILSGSNRKY